MGLRPSSPSPHRSSRWGEGRGEGQPLAPARVAAPHPNPLPTEEWGEGRGAAPDVRGGAAWRAVRRTALAAALLAVAGGISLAIIWQRMEPLPLSRAEAL